MAQKICGKLETKFSRKMENAMFESQKTEQAKQLQKLENWLKAAENRKRHILAAEKNERDPLFHPFYTGCKLQHARQQFKGSTINHLWVHGVDFREQMFFGDHPNIILFFLDTRCYVKFPETPLNEFLFCGGSELIFFFHFAPHPPDD